MSRRMLAVLAVVISLAASSALAWAPIACTPGFWKNHLLTAHGPHPALCPSEDFLFDCTEPVNNIPNPGANLSCHAGDGLCTCAELVFYTSAELGATAVERAAAQGCLNIVAQDQLGGVTIVCD